MIGGSLNRASLTPSHTYHRAAHLIWLETQSENIAPNLNPAHEPTLDTENYEPLT
jgi:hypothetical protein